MHMPRSFAPPAEATPDRSTNPFFARTEAALSSTVIGWAQNDALTAEALYTDSGRWLCTLTRISSRPVSFVMAIALSAANPAVDVRGTTAAASIRESSA